MIRVEGWLRFKMVCGGAHRSDIGSYQGLALFIRGENGSLLSVLYCGTPHKQLGNELPFFWCGKAFGRERWIFRIHY